MNTNSIFKDKVDTVFSSQSDFCIIDNLDDRNWLS